MGQNAGRNKELDAVGCCGRQHVFAGNSTLSVAMVALHHIIELVRADERALADAGQLHL